MPFVTVSDGKFYHDGLRFQGIGFNFYPFIVEGTSTTTVKTLLRLARAKGIKAFRTWLFDPGDPPSNSGNNLRYLSGGQLLNRETTWEKVDTLLYWADIYGIKIIFSFADNPTYDTKKTYVNWANSIYSSGLSTSYPYEGFFDSADCRTIYKSNFNYFANRVNTLNGRVYKNDPTIMAIELGNELRYDVFDAENGTQNTANSENIAQVIDWIEDVAGYMQTVDTNHLIAFSSCSHTWQWVNGDSVSNGSGYGVDYNLFAELPELDYLSFHMYPTQGGDSTQLKKYGQRLGYANEITADGFRAQMRDFVEVCKAAGKPAVMGEVGFVKEVVCSTQYYPLYPRHEAFRDIFNTFLGEADGDLVLPWSATTTSGGTYSIVLDGWNGSYTNANSDDRELQRIITSRNHQGARVPVSAEA